MSQYRIIRYNFDWPTQLAVGSARKINFATIYHLVGPWLGKQASSCRRTSGNRCLWQQDHNESPFIRLTPSPRARGIVVFRSQQIDSKYFNYSPLVLIYGNPPKTNPISRGRGLL